MSITASLCLSLFALVGPPQEPAAAPELALLTHAQLSAELKAIAGAHQDLVQLQKLGDSRGGRAIEGLRIAGPVKEKEALRPALLLVANLDGARVFSSAVALQHARALAQGYAGDERVKKLLDSTTVYVVPRANPDAAEARFETPRFERRASGIGVDNDRDGRQGEDLPADLNGDGISAWIRVQDPDGEWIADPTDPRALVKADRNKGEHGVYELWPEGRDLDQDELVAEDPLLDGRVDHNFPAGWEQHAQDAGLFATDDPETRALCDFVLAHTEIALVVSYDDQDDLVGDVKSVADDAPRAKLVPAEGILESDAKLLGELAKRYKKATESQVKGEGSGHGTFARWCYEQRGLLTLSAALWDIPLEPKADKKDAGEAPREEGAGEAEKPAEAEEKGEEPKSDEAKQEPPDKKDDQKDEKQEGKKDDEPKPSDDAKRLKWIDAAGAEEAWRFLAWTSFQHPELGAVEIGGFAPYARLEPPKGERSAIASKHLDFFLTLGECLPRVTIAECTREKLGESVFRVTAVVENDALLPLFSRSARRTETIRPAKVRLVLPEAAKLLGGEAQALLSDLPGSGGRKEYTWLVQGPAAMELGVSVETNHAGTAFRKAEEKKR